MLDQVTQARLRARHPRTGLFLRAHEVAEVHSPHSYVIHPAQYRWSSSARVSTSAPGIQIAGLNRTVGGTNLALRTRMLIGSIRSRIRGPDGRRSQNFRQGRARPASRRYSLLRLGWSVAVLGVVGVVAFSVLWAIGELDIEQGLSLILGTALATILSGAAAYGSGVNVGLGAERLELAARGAAGPPSLHKEDRTDH